MIILLLWWRHPVGDIVQQSMYLLHIGGRCLNEDNSLRNRKGCSVYDFLDSTFIAFIHKNCIVNI